MTDDRLARCRWQTGARYRTLPEPHVLDMLALAGWTFEARGGEVHALHQAAELLDRLIGHGLPTAMGPQGRCFDPVEVLNFLKWLGLAGRDGFWQDRFVATGRRLVQDLARRTGSAPVAVSLGFRRSFGAGIVPTGRPVRLRLPLPAPHASVSGLQVDEVLSGGLGWQVAPDGCRIELRGDVAADQPLSVSQKLRFTLSAGTGIESGRDLDPYLAPSEGHIQVTDQVRALAETLAPPGTAPAGKVAAFWAFLLDKMCLGAVHYDRFGPGISTPDLLLQTGWFDCQLGSALLVSLCRASGIPARLMGGQLLYPAAPTPHYWSEIWCDNEGWRPFDLACWDLSAGGQAVEWRDHFAGRIDPRITFERFPRQFTGASGARLPAAWHVSSAMIPGGAATTLHAVEPGGLIYRDDVTVSLMAQE